MPVDPQKVDVRNSPEVLVKWVVFSIRVAFHWSDSLAGYIKLQVQNSLPLEYYRYVSLWTSDEFLWCQFYPRSFCRQPVGYLWRELLVPGPEISPGCVSLLIFFHTSCLVSPFVPETWTFILLKEAFSIRFWLFLLLHVLCSHFLRLSVAGYCTWASPGNLLEMDIPGLPQNYWIRICI